MSKVPRVSDKELIKWTKILGFGKMIDLYVKDRISLTSDQLGLLVDLKEEGKLDNDKNN